MAARLRESGTDVIADAWAVIAGLDGGGLSIVLEVGDRGGSGAERLGSELTRTRSTSRAASTAAFRDAGIKPYTAAQQRP
jgi:hypothetical protein